MIPPELRIAVAALVAGGASVASAARTLRVPYQRAYRALHSPAPEDHGNRMAKDREAILGTMTDSDAAALLGVTRQAVGRARRMRGIKAFGRRSKS